MKLFAIHILIKDLSFLIFYLIIMKYNLTNETFLPETIREFPGAVNSTFGNIFFISIFYNWIPVLISFLLYYPIILFSQKLYKSKNNFQILLKGFILSLTTPLIYIFLHKIEIYSMKNAEIISWILTFIISMSIYFLLNQSNNKITERRDITI